MSKVYSISRIGKKVGEGVSDSYWIEVLAVGKWAKLNRRVVANEYICARLGTYLCLPVPPFALFATKGTAPDPWFGSIDYRLTGQSLPPVDPDECHALLPELSTGVICFDIWIANSDRHVGNLNLDKSNPAKPRMNVFDHSHALLGGEGVERLRRCSNSFGVTETTDPGANRHCLLDGLQKDDYVERWVHRIEKTPDFLINDACETTVESGLLDKTEGEMVRRFLTTRRDRLRNIINQNKNEFRSIEWSWLSTVVPPDWLAGNTAEIWDGPHI